MTTFFAGTSDAIAQYKIRGTVYDSTRRTPIQSVSVISSSGSGTMTNADGQYEIAVAEKDSIWFSYLNKPTVKFPILKIQNTFAFDIALNVNVPVLKEIKIRQRNYKQDSIQNREDYARVFDYEKPGLHAVRPSYGQAAGFDLNEIISAFNFKKIRSMRSFQRRLLEQEQDKFLEHRFNKGLVRRLSGLTEPAIDSFMTLYRPAYIFVLRADDYTFQLYIKESAERFKKGLPPMDMNLFFRNEEEEYN
ncbi:MAG: hypothetical protein EOO09_03115 [Chitinophagaceae bacterium]|nr:MAG: hypothetical protein EOO09_03115 [Chitinophagaceae bacterium]